MSDMAHWSLESMKAKGLEDMGEGARFLYVGIYFKIIKKFEDGSAEVRADQTFI
jgi:hypothetical protein